MARYVDIDKTIEEARLAYCKDCNSYNGIRCRACAFDDAMLHIEDAPTADVVEVKHGYWKECFEDWRKQIAGDECSACGFQHYGTCISHYHYCPNCGAKMDEKKVE